MIMKKMMIEADKEYGPFEVQLVLFYYYYYTYTYTCILCSGGRNQ